MKELYKKLVLSERLILKSIEKRVSCKEKDFVIDKRMFCLLMRMDVYRDGQGFIYILDHHLFGPSSA